MTRDRSKNSPGEAVPRPGRRGLLLGLGALGGGAAAGLLSRDAGAACPMSDSVAGAMESAARQAVAFHGRHQAGVTAAPPGSGLVASFNVLATSRGDLERLFRTLTQRIAFLMRGGTPQALDPRFPPPNSGLLGPVVTPDSLTVTAALGASLFDERFGLSPLRPRDLVPMPQYPNDALEAAQCHGDLLLQICADSHLATIHALRDIVKTMPDLLMLRWKQDGFLPPLEGRTRRAETPRNLLGFKDGTANPPIDDQAMMERVVWVQPNSGEPAWAAHGSYLAVRLVRNFVERWDRTPLREQQAIIGRDKASGAPLGMAREQDVPDYALDPKGEEIPLDAHIRLANPRTPGTVEAGILHRHDGQGLHLVLGQDDQGEEKLVPGDDELPDRDEDEGRPDERQRDVPVGLPGVAAVDARRLEQLLGQVLHERLQDDDGEGHAERGVGHDEAEIGVHPAERLEQDRQRQDERGHRNHQRRQDHRIKT